MGKASRKKRDNLERQAKLAARFAMNSDIDLSRRAFEYVHRIYDTGYVVESDGSVRPPTPEERLRFNERLLTTIFNK